MPKKRFRTPNKIKIIVGQKTEKRILVPKNPFRPFIIKTGRAWRGSDIQKDPWWFVLHRRPRRSIVGIDPLEARAIPKSQLRGTLPERIVFAYLVEKLRFVPNIDFDFQSSLDGGRLELGGIVADFLFPSLKIILQVQGEHHNKIWYARRDDEQALILERMGYKVFYLYEHEIYDEYLLEEIMRRIFGLS